MPARRLDQGTLRRRPPGRDDIQAHPHLPGRPASGSAAQYLVAIMTDYRTDGPGEAPELAVFLMMLSPVRVTCTRCGRPSPAFTYRDDGGADYTADLRELAEWAEKHQCLRNV